MPDFPDLTGFFRLVRPASSARRKFNLRICVPRPISTSVDIIRCVDIIRTRGYLISCIIIMQLQSDGTGGIGAQHVSLLILS